MPIESFEQLEGRKESHGLVLSVYKITARMPAEEKFGLISQMRRAAVSVPANIAEGFKRRHLKDKCHFYNISQGSLEELRYYFLLYRDLGYELDHTELNQRANQVGRMLNGLVKSMQA